MKADPSQKASEEAESAAGLGPDLTASVETTYSEQSSSSAGSASSSEQPIYFRYGNTYFLEREIKGNKGLCVTNNKVVCETIQVVKNTHILALLLCYFQGVSFHL